MKVHVCLCTFYVCVKNNALFLLSGLWYIHARLFPLQSASGHKEGAIWSTKEWDQGTMRVEAERWRLDDKAWDWGWSCVQTWTSKWSEATNSHGPTWIWFLILISVWFLTNIKCLYVSAFFYIIYNLSQSSSEYHLFPSFWDNRHMESLDGIVRVTQLVAGQTGAGTQDWMTLKHKHIPKFQSFFLCSNK